MSDSNIPDLYGLLRLKPPAEIADIKRSYRQLALDYHPDSGNGDNRAMVDINLAYSILSDPEKKKRYDLSLGLTGPKPAETGQNPMLDELYYSGVRFFSKGDIFGRRERIVRDEKIKRQYLRQQISCYLKARANLSQFLNLAGATTGFMVDDAMSKLRTLDRIIPIHQNEIKKRPFYS